MKKKAFLSCATGQDARNLIDYLLSMDYEIHAMLRRNSVAENQDTRVAHLVDKIHTYYGDLTDVNVIEKLMREIQPDEIYHLAAMSHVKVSGEIPSYTIQANGLGTLNMLESYKNNCPKARFYFAASSECFGLSVDADNFQRESTMMNPVSIYGCSKVLGYNLTRHYRRAYGLHAVCGILFNHCGEHRSSAFAEMKIAKAAVRIKFGMQDTLEMGNLDAYRDFGNSKDYVRAMHLIVNHDTPDDFVVATGETHSIRDICKFIFEALDMDYQQYVVINPKYFRPEELPYLRGDSSKIRQTLGWKPEHTFEETMQEMINFQLKIRRA